ncbi:MAG: pilus assembly protein PilX [Burkholderiales bacterium]|nr:pilus assembly protein PilX [Burkholderiales bacterium]
MNHPSSLRAPTPTGRGFTLLGILVIMVVLAFLALAAMNSSILQERMAGNARDKNVALQAAEAALRDAEIDIQNNLSAGSGFTSGCPDGLCLPPSMAASGAMSAPMWQSIDWSTQARAYGSRTGAAALVGPNNEALSAQPQYFVEMLPTLPPESGASACMGCTATASEKARAYRITARASGVRPSTVVMLQSVYIKQ